MFTCCLSLVGHAFAPTGDNEKATLLLTERDSVRFTVAVFGET